MGRRLMESEAILTVVAALVAALPGLLALFLQRRKDTLTRQSDKEKNQTGLEEVNQAAARALIEPMARRIEALEREAMEDRQEIEKLNELRKGDLKRISELELQGERQARVIERLQAELAQRMVEVHNLRDLLQVKTLEIDRLQIELDKAEGARKGMEVEIKSMRSKWAELESRG